MRTYRTISAILIATTVSIGLAAPAQAISGAVRLKVVKAGFGLGAGGGRGVLTFRHRNYPFALQGVSVGLAAGASVGKYIGRADYINELSDFSGTYTVVGAGGALIGGVGGVQLRNDKGVIVTLQGPRVGLELAANVSTVVIILDKSRSVPN